MREVKSDQIFRFPCDETLNKRISLFSNGDGKYNRVEKHDNAHTHKKLDNYLTIFLWMIFVFHNAFQRNKSYLQSLLL